MSKSGQTQRKSKNLRASVVAAKLKRQSDKERVKVAKELHKLQQSNLNPQQKLVDDINAALAQIERSLQSFGAAIQHLDARQGAMMLVIDDIVQRGIPDVSLTDDKTAIYWEAYIKHYIDNVRKELEQRAAAAQGSDLITPDTQPSEPATVDVVFGGDTNVEANP